MIDSEPSVRLTNLRNPANVDAYFASQLVDVAYIDETSETSADVRIEDVDLWEPEDREWISSILRNALDECGESDGEIQFLREFCCLNRPSFLVCYSWSPPDDHTRHCAIYMDQRFYELIWQNCRSESEPYTVLREIALLQYKSPTLVVGGVRLTQLDQDLVRLAESGVSHLQIAALREVCAKAVADGCALTVSVSGDMSPELWRTNA